MKASNLAWEWGIANFVMNRREPTPKGIVLGVNPRGYADRMVPVLRVESDGKAPTIVFGVAAHAGASAASDRVSGDHPGFAQAELESQYPGAQAMFIAGAAGDANAHPKSGIEDARTHGHTLALEVARGLGGKLKPVEGPLVTLLERADLPLPPTTRFVDGATEVFDKGGRLSSMYSAPFALWRFGDGLTLVGLSGEPVSDFAVMAARSSARSTCGSPDIPTTYSGTWRRRGCWARADTRRADCTSEWGCPIRRWTAP